MTPGESLEPLIAEATDWLLRLEEAPADPAVRAAAEAWRAADPGHGRAWLRAERAYRLMMQAPAAIPAVPPARLAPRPAGRTASTRKRFYGTTTALAACLLLLFGPVMLRDLQADVVTGTAEIRRVTLSDGTVVDLGAQSALEVRFSAERRTVALIAGQAFFNVAAQAGRPFEVQAADLTVSVVGTAFDVHLLAGATTVAVQHGVVQVRSARPDGAMATTRLIAGDQLTIGRRGDSIRRVGVAPEEVAAWRDHRLFVEGATVGDVVDELRRYSSGWIVVADQALARQQVTGLFDLRDPDRALRMLIAPFGGHLREITPFLKVVSGP